jgi:hypothetical protein
LVEAFNSVVKSYRVVIQLDSIECVKEIDEKGHSEPYIWPAFLRGDATTLPRVEVIVPFEDEAGRELLGEAGKDVRPGDVIPVPESLGRFETTVESFYNPLEERPEPLLVVGFVLALFEKDSTKTAAIAAGHQAFAEALRNEINGYISDNLAPPGADDIDQIKKAVRKRVKSAIRKIEGDWDGFWNNQDDSLGDAGGLDTTIFGAGKVHRISLTGTEPFVTPIRSKRIVPAQAIGGGFGVVEFEEQYDLHWHVDVQPIVEVVELNLPSAPLVSRLVDAVTKLQRLDKAIQQQVAQLRTQRGAERKSSLLKLEDQLGRVRPELVNEFRSAWEEFGNHQRSADSHRQEASIY